MTDLGDADCKIEQALLALKKGAQLLKYGRKGKPKFYPFRLSNDETSLIWISSSGERSLKLASVSRIIPGQRTAVFHRYLRPEKDYLSFSLIHNGGKRSLDLICKDKVEAEIWIAGLKTLTSSGQARRSKIDGWSDGGFYLDDNSNVTSNTPSNSSASATREIISSPNVSTNLNVTSSPKSNHPENSTYLEKLHVPIYQPNIQMKGSGPDAYRVSVSSAPSTSSHSSAADDCDALGDVYIWGEVICETVVKVGLEKNASSITKSSDILIPRLLESNVVLDVQHIACGVNHAALVTRQGEVFSWGKESGGRLGHGCGKDVNQPHLVESLTFSTVDSVACGEFHTCAVTMSGELYTWGDGTHYAGLLGHGTHVSHWIPKRIAGPLEGIQVAMVTCGPWHTALITSTGRLFTFGDGTFGVLGHGSRESASYPREVESLSGLRTVAVACGVWHTAAVIEVIATQSNASVFSGKMFTWGDGDKNRLGHGDKESRLNPTCVPALIDYNFHKVACGHSLTAGVTTSGQVFTMGSTVYGQLGNPQSDGKLPCLVGDKLADECVEEISCGAYHVAVLTSKNEVFTWGKGANGRLGHGDIEDRKLPTPVVTLKDRHVKFIACGSNYTSAICLHKWVSSAQQSQCSTCRQSFGFTRKKHNCYNCGLVHCHACSSRKSMWAVLAPNLNKPYRVCDSCFSKLGKMAESGPHNKRNSRPRFSGENKDRMNNADLQLAKSGMPSNLNLITQLDTKAGKRGKKADVFSLGQTSQISLLQLREAVMSTGAELRKNIPKPILTHSTVNSRPVSPLWSKHSSPRSATPVPTTSGLSFGKSISDGLNKTNDFLNRDVHKFRMQVKTLESICELQESELKQTVKKTQEAMAVAAKESAKCEAAKDVIKLLTAQLKDMAERLSPGAYDPDILKLSYLPNGSEPNGTPRTGVDGENNPRSETMNSSYSASQSGTHLSVQNRTLGASELLEDANNKSSLNTKIIPNGDANRYENLGDTESVSSRQKEGGLKERNSVVPGSGGHIEAEWIEQYEPGVYITLVALRDGTRDLKRVRFSRRRFGEYQAETWWSENRDNVFEKYNVGGSEQSSDYGRTTGRSQGALSPSSQF